MKTFITILAIFLIVSSTGCSDAIRVKTKYNITIDVINTDGTTSRVATVYDVSLYNNESFLGAVNTVDWEFNGPMNMLDSRSQIIEK